MRNKFYIGISLVVWLLLTIVIVDCSFGLISAPSDIKVTIGTITLLIYAIVSYETRFFTRFVNNKKCLK